MHTGTIVVHTGTMAETYAYRCSTRCRLQVKMKIHMIRCSVPWSCNCLKTNNAARGTLLNKQSYADRALVKGVPPQHNHKGTNPPSENRSRYLEATFMSKVSLLLGSGFLVVASRHVGPFVRVPMC